MKTKKAAKAEAGAWREFLKLSEGLRAGAQARLGEDLEGRLARYRKASKRQVSLTPSR
jgi:hypothetical protein